MSYRVPFNRPFVTGRETEFVSDALRRGHASGDGPYSKRCSTLLEHILGAPRVLLTTSGTAALDMIALLLDIGPGDEVIVPSFTFPSTANAFALRGARIVFADIRMDTLGLDEGQLERLMGPRTRAVVPVHYAGVACEMDAIRDVAARHDVSVVEDNAQGLFGSYRGRPLGSLGVLAALSFHETKNVTSGEGGAIVINDPRYAERAEIVREKGTDRSRFFRGQVEKYTWVDLGSSYVLSDLLAAVLLAQLEARDEIQQRRRRLWERYDADLADWCEAQGIRRPLVPEDRQQPYHMYHVVLPTAAARDSFIAHLTAAGILAVFHYQPLHLSEMGQRSGITHGDLPVTETVSERLVRLPFFTAMTDDEQTAVIEQAVSFSVGATSA